jgi:hypothetical protein
MNFVHVDESRKISIGCGITEDDINSFSPLINFLFLGRVCEPGIENLSEYTQDTVMVGAGVSASRRYLIDGQFASINNTAWRPFRRVRQLGE